MSKPLCPKCGHGAIRIVTRVTAYYDVVHDKEMDDLVILKERLEDADWDQDSAVRCPSCGWTGTLGAVQSHSETG